MKVASKCVEIQQKRCGVKLTSWKSICKKNDPKKLIKSKIQTKWKH